MSSSAAGTRLYALPADVLILILRFLPLVPRVRTVSRLSKHLNALVYRSIDDLSDHTHLDGSVLARLTSVTSLRVDADGQDHLLPTTLRTLHIVSNPPDMHSNFPGPLPFVTSLSLSLFGSQRGIADLMAKVATSLRSLQLFINMSLGPQGRLADYICTVHLPQLSDLRIAFTNANNAPLLAFFRRHALQLESLVFIHPPRPASLIADVALSNLTELSFAPPDMMAGLAVRCPKLTALHSSYIDVPTELPLRSLHLTLLDARLHHTTLTAIHGVKLDEVSAAKLVPHAHLVKSCTLLGPPSVAFLSAATRLTSLSIQYDLLSEDAPLAIPSLTELTLVPSKYLDGVFTKEIAVVRRFMRGCPRLTKITASQCSDLANAPTTLMELVSELDARGTVQALVIDNAIDGDDLKIAATSLVMHWLSVEVDSYPRDSEASDVM